MRCRWWLEMGNNRPMTQTESDPLGSMTVATLEVTDACADRWELIRHLNGCLDGSEYTFVMEPNAGGDTRVRLEWTDSPEWDG